METNMYATAPLDPPPYPGPPGNSSYPSVTAGQNNPPMYPPPITGQPNVTVTSATVIISNNIGPVPTVYVCPSCNQQILTRVKRAPSIRTHVLAVILCIFGCWPCIIIPYCTDSCNNAEHYCVNCNAYIGTHKV